MGGDSLITKGKMDDPAGRSFDGGVSCSPDFRLSLRPGFSPCPKGLQYHGEGKVPLLIWGQKRSRVWFRFLGDCQADDPGIPGQRDRKHPTAVP